MTGEAPAPGPAGEGPSAGARGRALPRRRLIRGVAGAAASGALGPLAGGCAGGDSAASPDGRTPGARTPDAASPSAPASAGVSVSAAATASPQVRAGGKPPPLPAGLPYEIVHGPRERSRVALTFHGQGDPALATALLAEAERAGARVTVLAVGTWLDEQPRMARRILDGGHELGNHTLHHADISAMSPAEALAEITGCAERLRRLTGSIGRWFRPSRARHATATVQRQARRAGYAHCLSYDLDSLDFTDPGAPAVRRTVLASAHGGSVVSLHLGHAGTVAALPGILDGLHGRGLRAVTVTDLLTG